MNLRDKRILVFALIVFVAGLSYSSVDLYCKHQNLLTEYNELSTQYQNVLQQLSDLNEEYDILTFIYRDLLEDYEDLNESYIKLQGDYQSLQSLLKEKEEALENVEVFIDVLTNREVYVNYTFITSNDEPFPVKNAYVQTAILGNKTVIKVVLNTTPGSIVHVTGSIFKRYRDYDRNYAFLDDGVSICLYLGEYVADSKGTVIFKYTVEPLITCSEDKIRLFHVIDVDLKFKKVM